MAVVTSTGEADRLFDGLAYEPMGDLTVPAQQHELIADGAANLLYVSHTYRSGVYTNPGEKTHWISVIDPFRQGLVDVISLAPEEAPHGLALDAGGHRLYATVEAGPAGGGAVIALDTITRKPTGRIEVGARGPHWFAITPDGRKGYATNKGTSFISVLDLVRCELTGPYPPPMALKRLPLRRTEGGPMWRAWHCTTTAVSQAAPRPPCQ
ncbi:YncE family protein [Streptomyces sp. NPDC058964]|uniref:YncE family protein n=1 Tax=Streptomyces sp. NPDC058964 TaxID=3346681 RepID=UPI0036B26EDE